MQPHVFIPACSEVLFTLHFLQSIVCQAVSEGPYLHGDVSTTVVYVNIEGRHESVLYVEVKYVDVVHVNIEGRHESVLYVEVMSPPPYSKMLKLNE